jgi:hypothetical protein
MRPKRLLLASAASMGIVAAAGACDVVLGIKDVEVVTDAGDDGTPGGGGDAAGARGDAGGADATGADATVREGGPIDAAILDGPAPDSGVAADSGHQAEGGPTGFCASLSPSPAFCDDFDGVLDAGGDVLVASLGGSWDTTDLSINANLTVDTRQWVSPPASLESAMPALNNATAIAQLTKKLTASPGTKGRLAFDVLIDPSCYSVSGGGRLDLGQIDFAQTPGAVSIELNTTTGSLQLSEVLSGVPQPGVNVGYLPTSGAASWFHMELDVEVTSAQLSASLSATTLDGGDASGALAIDGGSDFDSSAVNVTGIALGVALHKVSVAPSGCAAHFDNVTFDFPP